MSGFTKLFSSIVYSTIWREEDHVRLIWITMLALSDKNGIVEASIPGLADIARVTIEQCQEALSVLRATDKYSRNKDYDGRRIEEVDGGWCLLNYEYYKNKMREEEARHQNARRQAKHREKQRNAKSVTERDCSKKITRNAESYTDADTEFTCANIEHQEVEVEKDKTSKSISIRKGAGTWQGEDLFELSEGSKRILNTLRASSYTWYGDQDVHIAVELNNRFGADVACKAIEESDSTQKMNANPIQPPALGSWLTGACRRIKDKDVSKKPIDGNLTRPAAYKQWTAEYKEGQANPEEVSAILADMKGKGL